MTDKKRRTDRIMALSRCYPTRWRALLIALSLLAVSTLVGCEYVRYYTRQMHQQQTFRYFPSVSALNEVAPQDSLFLTGAIIKLQKRQEPLLLAAVSCRYRQDEKVALVQLPASSDTYTAFLPKGAYELYVFADIDRDGDFEGEELIGHASVQVNPSHAKNGVIVEGPPITVNFEQPAATAFHVHEKVRPISSVYSSLDDEFFDPQYGSVGLYNPSELMAHTQGFVFGLEGYSEDNRTIVLFVHGISGTPRDWKFLTAGLDRRRFQPLYFYYPSGLRLDKLGTLLAQTISSIDKSSKRGRHNIVLVAHSMGGLVALSAIDKLSAAGLPSSLAMYCSFSTPYGGDDAAKKGIENAPVVVPVWRDIAVDSDFLRGLAKSPFPAHLPFYLFFSYRDTSKFKLGESSDGAVTLRTQLVPALEAAATRVMGFNETHVGILNSEEVRKTFLRLLDSITPPIRTTEAPAAGNQTDKTAHRGLISRISASRS
jgi:pimeloyl-ACP methyl ester carboxylesterase